MFVSLRCVQENKRKENGKVTNLILQIISVNSKNQQIIPKVHINSSLLIDTRISGCNHELHTYGFLYGVYFIKLPQLHLLWILIDFVIWLTSPRRTVTHHGIFHLDFPRSNLDTDYTDVLQNLADKHTVHQTENIQHRQCRLHVFYWLPPLLLLLLLQSCAA